jgi:hypothetical protein
MKKILLQQTWDRVFVRDDAAAIVNRIFRLRTASAAARQLNRRNAYLPNEFPPPAAITPAHSKRAAGMRRLSSPASLLSSLFAEN